MEFFLVVPLIVLVLVGALQVIGVARVRMEMLAAARDGVRVAATTPDPARAVDAALNSLPSSMRDRARVSVQRPSRVGVPAQVKITVDHRLGFPFPDDWSISISSSASMQTEK